VNWEKAKKACFERDEGKCRRCGREAQDCHHRKLKGMGGTADPVLKYGLANLISLCRSCHNWIHAHPAESYEAGWLVHSWDDPALIPIPDGRKYDF